MADTTICGMCERTIPHKLIRELRDIEIRGATIEVWVEFYQCDKCGETWIDLNSDYDYLAEAYKKYREKHGMTMEEWENG